MNDTPDVKVTEIVKSKRRSWKRRLLWSIPVLILAVGAGAFILSKSGLHRALVKDALDRLVTDVANSSDNNVVLSYQDVVIEGGLLDRHAVIRDPKIEQKIDAASDADHVAYATKEILLTPTSPDFSAFKAVLPYPIYGYKGSDADPMLAITPKTPFEVHSETRQIDEKPFVVSQMMIPDSILVDGPKAKRGEPWNQFTLQMKSGATVTNSFSLAADAPEGLGNTDVNLQEIVLTPEANPQGAISIKELITHYNNMQSKEGASVVEMSATIGDITADAEILPYAPISFAMDLRYEGLLSKAAQDFASGGAGQKTLKVKSFSIKAKDAGVSASADFVSGQKDILPTGTANLTINNVPFILKELRAHEILREDGDALADALVTRITGKTLAESQDVSIDISRVHDGAFQIGQATFEELMALVLKAKMTPPAPAVIPPAPTPDASDKNPSVITPSKK
jgi:hypothetical protein